LSPEVSVGNIVDSINLTYPFDKLTHTLTLQSLLFHHRLAQLILMLQIGMLYHRGRHQRQLECKERPPVLQTYSADDVVSTLLFHHQSFSPTIQ
jgi:hypothetical protein